MSEHGARRANAQPSRVILAVLSLGGVRLRAAPVAGRAGAAGAPARPAHLDVGCRVGLHGVPARRVGRDADRGPARRHVRQEARARDRARRARRRQRSWPPLVDDAAADDRRADDPGRSAARSSRSRSGSSATSSRASASQARSRSSRASSAIGGGLGIVLAGPILENLSYHWLFWIPLRRDVDLDGRDARPRSRSRRSARRATCHWLGRGPALGLARRAARSRSARRRLGLGLDPKTLGLLVLAAVLAALWVWAESRVAHPLVDMQMMRLRRRLDDEPGHAA